MKTTPDKIVRVADLHIKQFEKRILIKETGGPGARNINLEDCKHYLQLWKSIKAKGGENLTVLEGNEVRDAYDSGEYDDIFKETN